MMLPRRIIRACPGIVPWAMLIAALGVTARPGACQTDSTKKAAAEALFRAGRALMASGDIAEACRKFEASQKVLPAAGTLLNLAVCHEREGRTATAWTEFEESVALAQRNDDAERERLAREHAQLLERVVPRITIQVPSASRITGLEIFQQSTPIPEAAWGTPIPVDPGWVAVRATAPGHVAWETRTEVRPSSTITVEVPALELIPAQAQPFASAPPIVAAAPPAPVLRPTPVQAVGPMQSPAPGSALRTGAWVAGGLGLLALVGGGYYGVDAFQKHAKSTDRCPNANLCYAEGVAFENEARTSAERSNVLIGAGMILVATSAIVLLIGPRPSNKGGTAAALSSTPWGPSTGPGHRMSLGWQF